MPVEAALTVYTSQSNLEKLQEREWKTDSSGQRRGWGLETSRGEKQFDVSASHLLKNTTVPTNVTDSSVASLCQGQQHLCGFGRGAQWWSGSPTHEARAWERPAAAGHTLFSGR